MDIFLSQKYLKLQNILLQHREIAIAFSGGVDSAFLLHAACAALGSSSVHAFHASSELLPPLETERVKLVVQERGCFFHLIEIKPLSWPEFVANGADRCYLCKKKIYQEFLADPFFVEGAVLCDGTNRDDLGQNRPGLKAVAELKVRTPLAEVGFTKKEIRLLSREFALSTWDTPASSCLATRIAPGESVTREKILLVARCEALLQETGFMGVRVRLCEGIATIAVLQKDLPEIQKKHVFSAINKGLAFLGLRKVVLDPQGRSDLLGCFSV
ncbi:MAG: TIGR00268 family protein [Deltaproteobacteria bacterium RIFOXYD12_FULL_55_16]|nr:MAG: TIGR00268 family protein [Deltaproteobacteria bacterium RIFOXYD12_FULL_55_16]